MASRGLGGLIMFGGIRRRFHKALLDLVVVPRIKRRLRQFHEALDNPAETQARLLGRILERHRGTAFGADHGFSSVRTPIDYQKALPIAGYDRLAPYIERMRQGEPNTLIADARVFMFALTSGTTATRKFIPVNESYLQSYRRGWNMWGLTAFQKHTKVPLTPILQLSGDWQEEFTPGGVPCGAVTGLTATMQRWFIRRLYCIPAAAGKVKDPFAKQYLALRMGMAREVGMILSANPSTLVNLARFGDANKESILRDMRDGTLDPALEVPGLVRQAMGKAIRVKHPARVRQLEKIIHDTGTLLPRDYWPEWTLLGNWTGGSMGPYLRQYPAFYGAKPVRDVGLIASEGRMTIPLEDGTPSGVLDIVSHYFEFVPVDEMDNPSARVLLPHELEQGQDYFILLTTDYGLYRYDIRDVVRCTGFMGKTPLLEFLNKGAYFSSMTGEKLSEHHVTRSIDKVLQELGVTVATYSVAPVWDDRLPGYGLYVERGSFPNPEVAGKCCARLEELLCRNNVEYEAKRSSARLAPLRLVWLKPGAWQAWDRERLAKTRGAAEQYKHPCLINAVDFRDTMAREGRLDEVV